MKKNIKQIDKQYLIAGGIISILTVIWLLSVSLYTSPLIGLKNGDTGIFMAIGKLWGEGYELYSEIFDHKGPLLFLTFMVPQLFVEGTMGVFILQCLLMIGTVLGLFTVVYKRSNLRTSIITLTSFVTAISFTMEEGFKSEEISLIFAIISMIILYKVFDRQDFYVKNIEAFILGVIFMIVAFIKVSNASFITAVIIFLGVMILIKNWKQIFKYALYGFLGAFVVTLPIFLYFYLRGTLYDMLNATFFFNAGYSGGIGQFLNLFINPLLSMCSLGKTAHFQIIFIVMFGLVFCSFFKQLKKKDCKVLFSAILIIVSFIAIAVGGNHFKHYLISLAPMIAYSMFELFNNKDKDKLILPLILGLVSISLGVLFNIAPLFNDAVVYSHERFENSINPIVEHIIPVDERDSVLGINFIAEIYNNTDIKPYHKYFLLQEWWGQFNPSVLAEIQFVLDNNPPLWVISNYSTQIKNKGFLNVLENQYTVEYDDGYYVIWRLKTIS